MTFSCDFTAPSRFRALIRHYVRIHYLTSIANPLLPSFPPSPSRSGTSVFHRPPPIDLSSAREAAFALDIDLDDDEAVAANQLRINLRSQSNVGDNNNASYSRVSESAEMEPPRRGVGPVGGDRGRENLDEEDEAMWDRLG